MSTKTLSDFEGIAPETDCDDCADLSGDVGCFDCFQGGPAGEF